MFDKEKLTLSVMANHYYHNNHSFMRDTDPDRNCSFFNKQQSYEYNINDFNTINKPDMFSMIHANIRSLPKNFDNLVIFLRLLNRNLSCIGISETWLSDISPIDAFNIPNYSFLCKSHSSKRGGGVGIYVNKTYNYKERTDLSIFYEGIFESIFVEIETNDFEKTLIGVIYRPPEYSNIYLFNEYIQAILHKLSKTKNPTFIIGDFNIDMLTMTDTTITLINTMSTFCFKPNIFSPTRLNKDGKFTSLIDNIFTNTTNDSFSGTIVYYISDHLPIFYSTYKKTKQTMNLDIRHTHGTLQNVVWMTLFAKSHKKIG